MSNDNSHNFEILFEKLNGNVTFHNNAYLCLWNLFYFLFIQNLFF